MLTPDSVLVIQQDLLLRAAIRSRFSVHQLASLALLLVFVAQCLWFMAHVPLAEVEGSYVEEGSLHIDQLPQADSADRSPLVSLLAGIPARVFGGEEHFIRLDDYRFVIRLPFLFAGVMLGASLWYVARRLYGNLGGYIALALYAFSPMAITRSSQVDPEIIGAWGAFGLIFTAIAVAHTLYAPREVVLWNWRRILLMGLAIAICVAAQFALWIVLVPALAFMLWVGYVRPGAAAMIFGVACVVGLVILWALYFFQPAEFSKALATANWIEFAPRQFASRAPYALIGVFLLRNGPGLLLLLAVTLSVFLAWQRTRYFGTVAPLIVSVGLLACTIGMQHYGGASFLFIALPFLILFAGGVSTDMLESRYAVLANALVVGVLIANAMLSVYGLLRLSH